MCEGGYDRGQKTDDPEDAAENRCTERPTEVHASALVVDDRPNFQKHFF